jgi:molybdopterin synthase catalytic subunit
MQIRVQSDPFEMGRELDAFSTGRSHDGAVVTFSGLVRDTDGLTAMEIEHYPGMTERAIGKIAAEAVARWGLSDVLVIHRYGRLVPGEAIMMVATLSRHRQAAFEAAEFLMDYLKSRAPFWKKEYRGEATGWVDAKDEDEAALDRWTPGA